jgi:hypothetical protein
LVGFDERQETLGVRQIMTVSLTVVVEQHSLSTPPSPSWLRTILRRRWATDSFENSWPRIVTVVPPSSGA